MAIKQNELEKIIITKVRILILEEIKFEISHRIFSWYWGAFTGVNKTPTDNYIKYCWKTVAISTRCGNKK